MDEATQRMNHLFLQVTSLPTTSVSLMIPLPDSMRFSFGENEKLQMVTCRLVWRPKRVLVEAGRVRGGTAGNFEAYSHIALVRGCHRRRSQQRLGMVRYYRLTSDSGSNSAVSRSRQVISGCKWPDPMYFILIRHGLLILKHSSKSVHSSTFLKPQGFPVIYHFPSLGETWV